ncbi:KTSC domain-containing protein [Fusobacterium sp. MFO224]|uniref:KTSC domain-containing protein n=1 Tax=Fusobacterium sp. MFO224 TaxID=3378070 RepID=UPI0038528E41
MVSMIPVNSSNVKSVGYEKRTSKLFIVFLSDSTYVYFGVPETEYQNLLDAGSKSRYLSSRIKDNYKYQRIN